MSPITTIFFDLGGVCLSNGWDREQRRFTIDDITTEIMQLSVAFPETLQIVRALRRTGKYLLATINNESRALNEHRVERFGLRELFTAFFTSCYLNLLKPQPDHYRRAMQIT